MAGHIMTVITVQGRGPLGIVQIGPRQSRLPIVGVHDIRHE